MATPNERLAESLGVLKDLQAGGRRVFRSEDLSRVHRERLGENGFLQEVMKGWLISSSPSARAGDSTGWYASFWEFCGRYADQRFNETWHLSAEQSLVLHGEKTVIPEQVVVCSPKAANNMQPCVPAVLGHWLFGYIHPYPDGNGRIARFLMNVMLASGGIPVDGHSPEGPQGLPGGARQRKHRDGHRAVRDAHRATRPVVACAARTEIPQQGGQIRFRP
jgi:hypothetical protein